MQMFEFAVQGLLAAPLGALLGALLTWWYQHRAEKIRAKIKLVEETGYLVTGWHNSLLELYKHAEMTADPKEILITSRFYTWTRYYLPRLQVNIGVLESESLFPESECKDFVIKVKAFRQKASITCRDHDILNFIFASRKLTEDMKKDLEELRNLSHNLITRRYPDNNQDKREYSNIDQLLYDLTDIVESVAELEGKVLATYYLAQKKWYYI